MSVADQRRGRHRPRASAVQGGTFLGLFLLCAFASNSRALRPSDHGLAFQKNATGVPPAMAAFFRGDASGSVSMALPQARNATDSIWDVAGQAAPGDGGDAAVVDGRDRGRTVLLTAGVVCGAVGVALLAAAAFAYLIQARRAEAQRSGAQCGGGG